MGGRKKRASGSEKAPLSKDVLANVELGSRLLEDSNKRLSQIILHYEEKIALLEKKIHHLQTSPKQDLVSAKKNLEQQVQTLEHHLQSKEKVLDHLRKKLDILRVEHADLQHASKKLQKELETRNSAFDYLQKALAVRKDEVALARDVNVKLQEKEMDAIGNVKKVEQLLREQKTRLLTYEKMTQEMAKKIAEFKSREKLYAKKLILAQEKISQLEQTQEHVHTKEEMLSNHIRELQSECDRREVEAKKFSLLVKDLTQQNLSLETSRELLRKEIQEKEQTAIRLQEALEARKKETENILQLNKQLIDRDEKFHEDFGSLKHLLTVKNLKAKQYEDAIKLLYNDLQKQKELVQLNSTSYQELSIRCKLQQEELVKLRQENVLTKKELHEKEKKVLDQEADITDFKARIQKLFGVNDGLEREQLHFKEYLSKLHSLVAAKEQDYLLLKASMDARIAGMKKEFENKTETTLKAHLQEVISVKAQLFEAKAKLAEKELQLQSKEHLERQLLKDLAARFGALLGNNTDIEHLQQMENNPIVRPLPTEILLQPMFTQQQSAPHTFPPAQQQRYQQPSSRPSFTPSTFTPARKESTPEIPLAKAKEQALPSISAFKEHDYSLNDLSPIGEAELVYAEGEIIREKEETMPQEVKALQDMKMQKHAEISTAYRQEDALTPMIDIGLQQGEDIEEIKQSLIQTGFDPKEVEEAILRFKKGKIGFS